MAKKTIPHQLAGIPYKKRVPEFNTLDNSEVEQGITLLEALIRLQSQLTGIDGISTKVTNVENKYLYYEVYELITTNTGTITKTEGATILLGRYKDAGDAIVVKIDSNDRPIDEAVRTSMGEVVVITSFDTVGNYVLSGIPDSYPIALVYQIKIPLKDSNNVVKDSIVTNFILHDVYAIIEVDDLLLLKLNLDQTSKQTLTTSPIINNLTAGRIPFSDTDKSLTDDAGLIWDNVNKRIGIGTNTPVSKLDMLDTVTDTAFTIQNGTTTLNNSASIDFFVTNNPTLTNQGAKISCIRTNSPAAVDCGLAFYTRKTTLTEGMRLTSVGLGIGTTTPESKLTVSLAGQAVNTNFLSGTTPLSLLSGSGTNIISGIAMASNVDVERAILQFRRARGNIVSPLAVQAEDILASFGSGGYSGASTIFSSQIDFIADGAITSTTVPQRISFLTGTTAANRTERMVIKSGGNVGIGTTAPSEKLDVNGNIKAAGYKTGTETGQTSTITNVVDTRMNNGQLQKKTQTLTFTNGLLTATGEISDWANTTDV